MDGQENTAGIPTSSAVLKPKPENVQLEMEKLSHIASSAKKIKRTRPISKIENRQLAYKTKFPLHWAAAEGKYEDFEKTLKNVSENSKLLEIDSHGNTILIKLCHRHVAQLVEDGGEAEDSHDSDGSNKEDTQSDDSSYSDTEDTNGIVNLIKSYIPTFCACPPKEGDNKKPNHNRAIDESEDSDDSDASDDSDDSDEYSNENEVTHNNKFERMIVMLMERVTANNTDSKDEIKKFINTVNYKGNSALHYVAMNVFEKLVELLLNQGADASLQNDDGDTPLHLLTERRSEDAYLCTKHLLEKMPNKNILNRKSYSALCTAMSEFSTASPKTIKLMIDKGCSVSYLDNSKKPRKISILHEAVVEETTTNEEDFKSFEVFVQALSEEEINRKEYGDTALHIAAYYLEVHFLKYLLAHEKIDLYKTDDDGNNALHLVAERGSGECVELLMSKAGSDAQKKLLFNQKNRENRTALGISVQKDSVPLAKTILMSHPHATDVLDWMKPGLIERIYEKMPEIFLPILNEYIVRIGKIFSDGM